MMFALKLTGIVLATVTICAIIGAFLGMIVDD
jgi:hypothetical protein